MLEKQVNNIIVIYRSLHDSKLQIQALLFKSNTQEDFQVNVKWKKLNKLVQIQTWSMAQTAGAFISNRTEYIASLNCLLDALAASVSGKKNKQT